MVALSNSMPSTNMVMPGVVKPMTGGPGSAKMSGGKNRRGGSGRIYSGSLLSNSYLNSGATDKSSGINNIAFLGGRRRTKRSHKTRKSRRRRH